MSHTNIKLYGTDWCSDCKRSKRFLGEQRVHYEYVNIEENMEGQAFVRELQKGGLTIPTIAFEDGSVLIEPSNAELAAKLGLQTRAKCEFYDLITVGGGPTALEQSRDSLRTPDLNHSIHWRKIHAQIETRRTHHASQGAVAQPRFHPVANLALERPMMNCHRARPIGPRVENRLIPDFAL